MALKSVFEVSIGSSQASWKMRKAKREKVSATYLGSRSWGWTWDRAYPRAELTIEVG